MIADEIKKAGQATIDQSVDLLTYKLTDTWTTYSGDNFKLGALACNTGGTFWFNGDYSEWTITFSQDVCRYNGTPVKTFLYADHGHGDYSSYEVYDFADNQLYYSENNWPTGFTVRRIEFQNNKQSFQLLNSDFPTYTDDYYDKTKYAESYLLNARTVPNKPTLYNSFYTTITSLPGSTRKTLQTVNEYSNYALFMISAVISDDYNWGGGTYPSATCELILTLNDGRNRYIQFNYYNPGNAMIMLRPGQSMKIELWCSMASGNTTRVLTTVERISL